MEQKILIVLFTWEMVDLLGLLDLLERWWFHMLSPGGAVEINVNNIDCIVNLFGLVY